MFIPKKNVVMSFLDKFFKRTFCHAGPAPLRTRWEQSSADTAAEKSTQNIAVCHAGSALLRTPRGYL